MAQFYTLEEAARVLGMGPEELKAKAQHREVRAFLDGGSWRFRVADVDELARRRGLGSDADLNLSDLDLPGDSGGDIDLSEFALGNADEPGGAVPTGEFSRPGSDHDLLLDDLSLPPNPVSGSSSVIIGMDSTGKHPSDSDVRLLPDNTGGVSDSDVRLAPEIGKGPSDSDVTLIADDTSQHDLLAPSGSGSDSGSQSGDTAVRPSPLLGSSAEVAAQADSDSDFELTPSSVIDALQPDSGSDFELSALDGSDEFEATPLRPSDSDVTAADPGLSGINLSRPSDSGINLQTAGGMRFDEGESIELAPLSGDDIKSTGSRKPQAKSDSAPKPKPNLAATPVPGKAGGKDIFDDTDFEVDAFSSDDDDDRTKQLEAVSDFEIEESDTGSEVFSIDDEDVDPNEATSIGSVSLEDDDEEEDDGFEDATSGEMASGAWDVESEGSPSRPSPAVLATRDASAEWGGLWVGLLGTTSVFMLLLTFVGMDLVRNLYEKASDSPASGLVQTLAGLIGGK